MNATVFKAALAIFFAELFNALNVNAQKFLLPDWSSPFAMLLLRAAFGMFFFWVLSFFVRQEKVSPKDLLFMLSAGALSLTAYMTFYLLGVEKSSPVDSSLIMSAMPITVLIFAFLFFKEKLSLLKITGMVLGMVGTVLIILIQEKKGPDVHTHNSVMGNIFCLFSAVSYGFYLIVNKRLAGKYNGLTMLKWIFTGAFVFSIPLILIFGWDARIFTAGIEWEPLSVFAFVMIFPTGLTYLLIPYALKKLQATTVAMFDYEVPIVASVVGISIGQARFGWYQPVAAALIFTGVYLVSRENSRLKKQNKDSLTI